MMWVIMYGAAAIVGVYLMISNAIELARLWSA